jgi:hypothetical protein
MAYTNDWTKDAGNYNISKRNLDEVVTLTRYFDCSADNLGSGEYTKIFTVPAGTAILEAYTVEVTAEGTDYCDVTVNDATTITLVNNGMTNAVDVTNARAYCASESYICLKPDAALTSAKFYVIVRCMLLSTSM